MPPRLPAPPLVPLIVGINGRRDLGRHGDEIEDELYTRLKELAEAFPHAPMMVLTSLAEGADWCAARAVARLERDLRSEHRERLGYCFRVHADGSRDADADDFPRVTLVCPLPFALDVYADDFPGQHEARVRMLIEQRRIEIAGRARTTAEIVRFKPDALIWFPLAPLVGSDAVEIRRRGGPCGPSGRHRKLHYEQVGVFVADHCHLLISVMEADATPEAVGGTARIVHYKCTGGLPPSQDFDDQVAALAMAGELKARLRDTPALDISLQHLRAASLELQGGREASDWFSHGKGYVWQLTLPRSSAERPTWRALTGKAPQWIARNVEGPDGEPTEHRIYEFSGPGDGSYIPDPGGEASAQFLFRAVDRFDRRLRNHEASAGRHKKARQLAPWWQRLTTIDHDVPTASAARRDADYFSSAIDDIERKIASAQRSGPPGDLEHWKGTLHVVRQRNALSDLQETTNAPKSQSLIWIARFFVASVAAFSAYKMLHHLHWLAVAYLVALAGALLCYVRALITQISARHQDYRAAAEAMRVLTGWRLAGMSDRIEDYYVPGTMKELERVRDGVRMISAFVALRYRASPLETRPSDVALARKHWSTDQKNWFRRAQLRKHREARARVSGIVSTFSLATGIFLGTLWHEAQWTTGPAFWLVAASLLCVTGYAYHKRNPGLVQILRQRLHAPTHHDEAQARHAGSSGRASSPAISLARRRVREAVTLSWAFFPCVLAVMLVVAAFTLLHGEASHADPAHASDSMRLAAAQWLGLLTAILNGAAGALVYLFEKSAVESEARNYDEMQHVFASAEQMLDATGQAAHVAPGERLARQHRILRELGRAALAENSYWLRAHRERPVEPIAGG